MQIDIGLITAITERLGTPGMSNLQVNKVIGDVVNQRTRQGKYGSLYHQDNDDVVYMPVQVDVGQDMIPGTNSTYAELFGVPGGKWWLPYPIMGLDLGVHVVDTELTERDGMVSELINNNFVKIHIVGFLVNTLANEFPEDDYDTLVRLRGLKHPFKINNPKTDIVFMECGNNNKTVTLRSLTFQKMPGVQHVQVYEMELAMDMPFDLNEIS